jgi:hypothetical protein
LYLAVASTGLARVALAEGNLVEASAHLRGAFKTPPQSRLIRQTIDAIATWSELLQAEGQFEAASELCAALLSWPATPIYAPTIMQHLRAELEARLQGLAEQLPPEAYAAAVARGQARAPDEIVAEQVSNA